MQPVFFRSLSELRSALVCRLKCAASPAPAARSACRICERTIPARPDAPRRDFPELLIRLWQAGTALGYSNSVFVCYSPASPDLPPSYSLYGDPLLSIAYSYNSILRSFKISYLAQNLFNF